MVKNALEPYWEARFEGISYGFRPGRGCHDAIQKIQCIARANATRKWVLDADIEGAFDNIGHCALQEAIGNFPARELIKQWLKAGYVEEDMLYPTETGCPQGGVISPLLLNIALHGMEEALGIVYNPSGPKRGKYMIVRYADDFAVFCRTREEAEEAKRLLTEWLETRGLRLSEKKTRICHLTEGFNFLGFNVRQYPAPNSSRRGYKLQRNRRYFFKRNFTILPICGMLVCQIKIFGFMGRISIKYRKIRVINKLRRSFRKTM